jgi:hypothetical protein
VSIDLHVVIILIKRLVVDEGPVHHRPKPLIVGGKLGLLNLSSRLEVIGVYLYVNRRDVGLV